MLQHWLKPNGNGRTGSTGKLKIGSIVMRYYPARFRIRLHLQEFPYQKPFGSGSEAAGLV